MTADQLIERSKSQRQRDLREDALASATAATIVAPANAEAWWYVFLNTLDLQGPEAAIPALRRMSALDPNFGGGWSLLGQRLKAANKPKSAQDCFERALSADPEESVALQELAEIYFGKDNEKELNVLSILDRLGLLDPSSLTRLGGLTYQKGDYYLALDYFKRAAASTKGPGELFNLGLAYDQISQNADAIDHWRLCRKRYPEFLRAKEQLDDAVPRMVDLAARVRRRGTSALETSEFYLHYLNPLELLGVPADQPEAADNQKQLQRLRRALLREIELEDGEITWMPGLRIDRSKAICLCDEVHSENHLATYHQHVFRDQALLGFLSRGDLAHFLVDQHESPLETIELLDNSPKGFQAWLDHRFTKQFDFVFSRALERRDVLAIEVLLDGRRWISPVAADRCFEGSLRQVDRMLEPVRAYVADCEKHKPTLAQVQAILADGDLGRILSFLPPDFHASQAEALDLLRSVAIAAHNVHGDTDTAHRIVQLCSTLPIRSVVLKHKLDEDLKQLGDMITKEREDEVFLRFGSDTLELTRARVRFGSAVVNAEHCERVKWGMIVTGQAPRLSCTFSMVIEGGDCRVVIGWTASKDLESQKGLFDRLVKAALRFVLPTVVNKLRARIISGESVQFGAVTVSRAGVEVRHRRWLFNKTVDIPWKFLTTEFGNGDLILGDSRLAEPEARLPLASTDNAIALPFIADGFRGD